MVIPVTGPLPAVLRKSAAVLGKMVLPMVRDILDRAKTLLFLLRPFLERGLRIQNSHLELLSRRFDDLLD